MIVRRGSRFRDFMVRLGCNPSLGVLQTSNLGRTETGLGATYFRRPDSLGYRHRLKRPGRVQIERMVLDGALAAGPDKPSADYSVSRKHSKRFTVNLTATSSRSGRWL